MHVWLYDGGVDTQILSVKELAGALTQARRDMNLTQSEVAARAGVSLRWLIAAEAGQSHGAGIGRILQVLRVLDKAIVVIDTAPSHGSVYDLVRQSEV